MYKVVTKVCSGCSLYVLSDWKSDENLLNYNIVYSFICPQYGNIVKEKYLGRIK